MAVDKRALLLDAAERAILAEGFAGTSTRRIAQEAGVPLSLLHYYFGGKEGLLVALVERARDRNREAVQASLAGPGPALARAAAALQAGRQAFLDRDGSMRLLVELAVAALHNERLHVEVQRLYAETMRSLAQTAADLLEESGHAGKVDVRPEAIASLILAAGFGLALQRMLGVEERAAGEGFEALVRLLLGGMSAPAPARTPN